MDNITIPKKLLMIQDMVTVGRSSMSVAIPVVSACKVQACPIANAVFSGHMGFEDFYGEDLALPLEMILNKLKEIKYSFSGIYIGYLGSVKQLEILHPFLKEFQKIQVNSPIIIDPVFGDHGHCYKSVTKDYYEGLKTILSYSHIITPNITEACLLTNTPYHEGSYSLDELQRITDGLKDLGAKDIVITGVKDENFFYNYVVENQSSIQVIKKEIQGISRPGTGDIFASILSALYLRGFSLLTAVEQGADFISLCTKVSSQLGIPTKEGVALELFLHRLTAIS